MNVTGMTAEKMLQLAAEEIISGGVVGDDLILTTRGGTSINAGDVRGPSGPSGGTATVCTSTTRPGSPALGAFIYETDTRRTFVWQGTYWDPVDNLWICTSSTRPTSPWVGLHIFETDTLREYYWAGSVWTQFAGPAVWANPTFYNTWANYGAGAQSARYSKVNGIVSIEGAIKDGTASTAAFTMPAGFRPAADLVFPAAFAGSVGSMAILTNGDFYPCVSTWPASTRYNITCSYRASA